MRTARASIVCLIASLGACASQPAPETAASVQRKIDIAWRLHIEAIKNKDAVGVVQIYTDDIDYLVPGVRVANGRAEIQAAEQEVFKDIDLIDAVHTTDALEVYGDVAYELGTVAGPVKSQLAREATMLTFHFMAMWRLGEDGSWRMRSFVGLRDRRPQ